MKYLIPYTLALLAAGSAMAQTTYQWNGTTDTNWQTSGNWAAPGMPAFNTSVSGRLNVNNGASNPLAYTGAEGATTFTGAVRGLVINAGSMQITGGTFKTTTTGGDDIIGNSATGTLIVNGGNYTRTGGLSVGFGAAGNGTLTLTSGTVSVSSAIQMGSTATSTATINLDGGTLSANGINVGATGAGLKTFNFNGGTFKATATATFFDNLSALNVKAGGAKIDTDVNTAVINQALLNAGGTDGGLTKSGTGTLTLFGANTYNGATTVSAGKLKLSNALALQNSALDTTNSTTGSSTAGLQTTVATLTFGGLTGNKNLASLFATTAGYSTVTELTLNPGTGVTHTYTGVIANGANGMTLTKTGLGTQVLGAQNTYTGTTTVNVGTLNLGVANAINNSATNDIILGGGNLQSAFSQNLNLATLSLTAGTANVLDLSTGGTFVFANSNGLWGAGSTLSIIGTFTDGVSVQFGTDQNGLSNDQLAQITINGLAAAIDSSGFLSASSIPEPSTYAALFGALALVGTVTYRRRRS